MSTYRPDTVNGFPIQPSCRPSRGVEFFVPGRPVPQGSKKGFIRGSRVVLVESANELGPWRERVAMTAHLAMDGQKLFSGPITLALSFVLPRPKSAPKRSTPPAVKRPDVDKLTRAIFDSLSQTIFLDDSQVVSLHAHKRLAGIGETPGVLIAAIPHTEGQP